MAITGVGNLLLSHLICLDAFASCCYKTMYSYVCLEFEKAVCMQKRSLKCAVRNRVVIIHN